MTQPALEFYDRRGFILKKEVTEGTDAAPTTTANAFELFDSSSKIVYDKVDRKKDSPYFNRNRFALTNGRAQVSGGFELAPPTAPGQAVGGGAPCDVMLQIAGMAVTLDDVGKITRYSPISTGIPSATGWFYHAGILRKATGSRANISGLSLAVGSWFRANTELTGTCNDSTEAALPTDFDFSAFVDPVTVEFDNSHLLLGLEADGDPALDLWGKELSIDFGNSLQSKQFTQKKVNRLQTRESKFKLRCARFAKGDLDLDLAQRTGTVLIAEFNVAISDVITSALIVRMQVENYDTTDIEGDMGYELTGSCIATAPGNEFAVEYRDSTP